MSDLTLGLFSGMEPITAVTLVTKNQGLDSPEL